MDGLFVVAKVDNNESFAREDDWGYFTEDLAFAYKLPSEAKDRKAVFKDIQDTSDNPENLFVRHVTSFKVVVENQSGEVVYSAISPSWIFAILLAEDYERMMKQSLLGVFKQNFSVSIRAN